MRKFWEPYSSAKESRCWIYEFVRRVCESNNQGFPWGSGVKNPAANAGDTGLIPGSGRSPGEGNGKPLQCSCLGNPVDRGNWQATVHVIAEKSCNLATKQEQQEYLPLYLLVSFLFFCQAVDGKIHNFLELKNLEKNKTKLPKYCSLRVIKECIYIQALIF